MKDKVDSYDITNICSTGKIEFDKNNKWWSEDGQEHTFIDKSELIEYQNRVFVVLFNEKQEEELRTNLYYTWDDIELLEDYNSRHPFIVKMQEDNKFWYMEEILDKDPEGCPKGEALKTVHDITKISKEDGCIYVWDSFSKVEYVDPESQEYNEYSKYYVKINSITWDGK